MLYEGGGQVAAKATLPLRATPAQKGCAPDRLKVTPVTVAADTLTPILCRVGFSQVEPAPASFATKYVALPAALVKVEGLTTVPPVAAVYHLRSAALKDAGTASPTQKV